MSRWMTCFEWQYIKARASAAMYLWINSNPQHQLAPKQTKTRSPLSLSLCLPVLLTNPSDKGGRVPQMSLMSLSLSADHNSIVFGVRHGSRNPSESPDAPMNIMAVPVQQNVLTLCWGGGETKHMCQKLLIISFKHIPKR
jgi:hypothetical protein